MADFPLIPADVFRGTACDNVWSALVAHYQGKPDVTISEDQITEEASNGTVIQYNRDEATQTITWQMQTPSTST